MQRIFTYLAIGLALVFAYVKYIEGRGIYYPLKDIECTPRSLKFVFEDAYITTRDNLKINAWFIPAENPGYILLFCHGNAGNIGHRLEKIALLRKLGLNILIFDYRGYGRSQGSPSEKGFYLDARGAYDYLVKERKVSAEKIILYGESIGTAVAVDLAAQAPVKAVILEGAFSRGRDMAKTLYPFLPAFIFADSFNSLSKIRQVKAAKLFLHSQEDEIVPLRLCEKLFLAAQEPKLLARLRGSHNGAFFDDQDTYTSAIADFIKRL